MSMVNGEVAMEMGRWGVMALAAGWVSFGVWRKMRFDYPEEGILILTLWLALAAGIGGGVGGKWWGVGRIGAWGATWVGVWSWCRWRGWDGWEWADVWGRAVLWLGMVGEVVVGEWMMAGLLAVGVISWRWWERNYRSFRWYPSGKIGFLGLGSMVWWAAAEMAVAFSKDDVLYWGGVSSKQLMAAAAFCIVVPIFYLRSELKLAHKIWEKVHVKKERR